MLRERIGDNGTPANAATTGFLYNEDWALQDGEWVEDRGGSNDDCLHDLIEQHRPPSRKDAPHMTVCTCPHCSITC
jgi:hypothetical protein